MDLLSVGDIFFGEFTVSKSFCREGKLLDDVASLVMLAECLFGRAPFTSRTLEELGAKIHDTKPIEVLY